MYSNYEKIQSMVTRDNATWRRLVVNNAILVLGGRTQEAADYVAVLPTNGDFRGSVAGCREVFDDCVPMDTAFIVHSNAVDVEGIAGTSVVKLEEGKAIKVTSTDQYDPW